jgi:hypothetical protein
MEAVGIATVIIAVRAFREQLVHMTLPQVVTTPRICWEDRSALRETVNVSVRVFWLPWSC